MDKQPILSTIQPDCDALFLKMKEEKKAQGKTNQDVSDATGIPLSSVSKFFSGNLANPSFIYVAAACKHLGISIDEAFNLSDPKQTAEDPQRIAELEAKVHELELHLDYTKKDRANLEASLKSRKMIISVLFGVCILMIIAFGFGIIYNGM